MHCEFKIFKVVVIGRGAIGALYADALRKASGIALRVAVDEQRAARYRDEEFIFNGERLDLDYFTPQSSDHQADLIIIATKWDGYAAALDLIEPIVGHQTIVMPLLNGLRPYQMAEAKYGENRALRGYYIGHTASRDGNAATQDGAYRTVIGEAINTEGRYSERLLRLIEIFDRAKIKYRVDQDMESSRWLKFVINLGLNQCSALDGGLNYGQIRASKHYTELCRNLMTEGVEVAKQLKINGAETMLSEAQKLLDTLPEADYSSMAQDIRAQRATEWPIFGGHLLQIARQIGIELPAHKWIEETISKLK